MNLRHRRAIRAGIVAYEIQWEPSLLDTKYRENQDPSEHFTERERDFLAACIFRELHKLEAQTEHDQEARRKSGSLGGKTSARNRARESNQDKI